MKWSTKILTALLVIIAAGSLASNIVLKKEFDKIDKNDTYWTFGTVLSQPFKYLKLDGGNITKIAFEQSPNCSVRVLNDWQHGHEKLFDAVVKNDTLYIKFIYEGKQQGEKDWLKYSTFVRIFAPELLYIEGVNTRFEMFKLKQKNIGVNMSGRSTFEVESFDPDFDSVSVTQKDSSSIVFEMSPEYIPAQNNKNSIAKSSEAFTIRSLKADVQGRTLLDVGRATISNLNINVADTSAIILSGNALRTFCRQK